KGELAKCVREALVKSVRFEFKLRIVGGEGKRSTTSTRKVHCVRECELSHMGVLGEGLYEERFRLCSKKGLSDEDDEGDNESIDWVDNHIAIRKKRDEQM
ncbi:hypothetical protein Tco_1489696, partial [Tanacetum coccineum]